MKRIRVDIEGIVQGVGFRPFVYRLAHRCCLTGWVRNTPAGVELEAQGKEASLNRFLQSLEKEAPPLAVVTELRMEQVALQREDGFTIVASGHGASLAQISPDCDVCPDCLRELFDPTDRRYRYPFINCTNCGPRYSIITGIPYDRPLTTMADFPFCDSCREEYLDPGNRRFHAQPNACPACGPQLTLLDRRGNTVGGNPLDRAVQALREGNIVAVKGAGGYHLAVDAGNETAVAELRRRKKRDEKPFAVMAPGMDEVGIFAHCTPLEERLLMGTERPILLLRKREGHPVAPSVAPVNAYFGAMLPSTPLHHLLLRNNFTALVMTSGNLSDEPIAYADDDASARLAGVADYFLAHNRRIHMRADDSVIRVFQGGPLLLRRSRGYVPRGILLPFRQKHVLAVGAELKSAICLTRDNTAFMSHHIGDLQNGATLRSLEESADHLRRLLEIEPLVIAHDLHPDYLSTTFAEGIAGLPKVAVQHHHAHMASCMAENRVEGPVIGVILDGTGFGPDGTVWGGEFLFGDYRSFRRMGHFRHVPLPGGDAAVREPLRMAMSYCHLAFGKDAADLPLEPFKELKAADRRLLVRMIEQNINSPLTSSCGRLFDAVAALLGLRFRVSYEGQAAMELEALAERGERTWSYPYAIVRRSGMLIIDFTLMILALIRDLQEGVPAAIIARRFHDTLVSAAIDMCQKIRTETGVARVVLSGGVFQNRLFAEQLYERLQERGFTVFAHRLVPPNDGGIALGQAVIAGCREEISC